MVIVLSREQRNSVVAVSLVSAFFAAIYKVMDNITVHNFITATDGLTAAFAYLVVGGWIGATCGFIFAIMFGKLLIDPTFGQLAFKNKVMHKNACIAGILGASSTLFLLWGNQYGDPSAMIALGNITTFYVIAYEVFVKQLSARLIALPAVLIVAGAFLGGYSSHTVFTLIGILLVAIMSNVIGAAGEIVERKGVKASDGVNMYVWRFLWLALSGTVLAVIVSGFRGYLQLLADTVLSSLQYWWWMVILMFVVFLAQGLKLTLKKTNTVSVVLLATSAQIFLGYPMTLLGNLAVPGVFGSIPEQPLVWVVRIGGAMLLLLGLTIINQLKAKLKPEAEV